MKRMLVPLAVLLMAGVVGAPREKGVTHLTKARARIAQDVRMVDDPIKIANSRGGAARKPSSLGRTMRKASPSRSRSPGAAAAGRGRSPVAKRSGARSTSSQMRTPGGSPRSTPRTARSVSATRKPRAASTASSVSLSEGISTADFLG